jgi:hypothetical protein
VHFFYAVENKAEDLVYLFVSGSFYTTTKKHTRERHTMQVSPSMSYSEFGHHPSRMYTDQNGLQYKVCEGGRFYDALNAEKTRSLDGAMAGDVVHMYTRIPIAANRKRMKETDQCLEFVVPGGVCHLESQTSTDHVELTVTNLSALPCNSSKAAVMVITGTINGVYRSR